MEKKKKNQSNLLMLVLTSIIYSLILVSGGLVNPATDSTVGGSAVILNATNQTTGFNQLMNMTNCSFYAQSLTTGNSSWVFLNVTGNSTGTVASNSIINTTFDSRILEDSRDYQFNATCRNVSNSNGVGASSNILQGITIDNTRPQTATSLSPSGGSVNTSSTVGVSSTVVAGNTTMCTLNFVGTNPGNPTYNMTHSGALCTFTLNNVADQTYIYFIRSSDGLNNTDTSEATFRVSTANGGTTSSPSQGTKVSDAGKGFYTIAGEDFLGTGINNNTAIVIGIVIFIVLVIYFKRK